jgi:hypothetical protein
MISTIQDLTKNTFSKYSDVITDRPNLGDIYYDTSIGKIFVFDSGKWKQLNVYGKDYYFNEKRKYKIKKIFYELL